MPSIPKIQAAILQVPVDGVATTLESHSPFSSYCLLKDLCCSTLQTLVWADRYFDSSLFHLYLRDVRRSAAVTLLTWPETKLNSKGGKARWAEFLDVSRLFAAERGPDHYRLAVNEHQHARWLRCDGQLFLIGDSAKDAGRSYPFSVGKIDSSDSNFKILDDLISSGRELFGPDHHAHA